MSGKHPFIKTEREIMRLAKQSCELEKFEIQKIWEANLTKSQMLIYLTLKIDERIIHAQKFCNELGIQRRTLSANLEIFQNLGLIKVIPLDLTNRNLQIKFISEQEINAENN